MQTTKLSRRKFLQISSASGTMLAIGCMSGTNGKEKVSKLIPGEKYNLNQYISIDTNGLVTLYNHRPEMGQGTYQSIPMILAEELEVPIEEVVIKQSEADSEKYGSQMVVGSRSIQSEFDKMRKMGAMARELLKKAAAQKWNVPVSECQATNGEVLHNLTNKTLKYGELVVSASELELSEEPILKDPSSFKIIGKPIPRQDIPLKTNGEAIFGIDIQVPGMLYASIARSPVFLGNVTGFNQDEVLNLPGVKYVLKTKRNVYGHDREGVAVIAETYWQALQGRKALKIQWDHQGLDKNSSDSIMEKYLTESKNNGEELHKTGNIAPVLEKGNVVESVYKTPYQSHVPMEPMNAVVNIEKGKASFWGSTQNPNGIRSFIAGKYNIAPENVSINYTFMGGGFGRRAMTDVVEEAADLSFQAKSPIKVIWTREDDQTQGPFRACSLNICRGVLDDEGNIKALEHKVVAQEIRNQTGDDNKAGRQLMGGINTDYEIPNVSVKGILQKFYVPISYWRAVYHSTNPFAHESFIDELSTKAGKDPLDFRLSMLTKHDRFSGVLKRVAELSDWYSSRPKSIGKGVAIAERSGAHFAMVVEVKNEGNKVIPIKVTTAIDLGICVNPDTVKAQTEGSIIMGLTAVYAGLTIEKGGIAQQNFDRYPLLRYSQCPEIETVIIESNAAPDGAGEAGLPTIAPAFTNAVFNLSGKRIRSLPVKESDLTMV